MSGCRDGSSVLVGRSTSTGYGGGARQRPRPYDVTVWFGSKREELNESKSRPLGLAELTWIRRPAPSNGPTGDLSSPCPEIGASLQPNGECAALSAAPLASRHPLRSFCDG